MQLLYRYLTNPEVIAVNQDPLGIQGKKVAFASSQSPNASSDVIVADLSSSGIDPIRYKWTYNTQDGSIRSIYSGKCVSIYHCTAQDNAHIVLDDCHIGDPQALCQGKNQQWSLNISDLTIVSQMDGRW